MKSKNKSLLCVAVLIAFLTSTEPAQAWNSYWYYTHDKMTDDAIGELSEAEYPDIHKFAEKLRDGSETEGSHNPPGDLNPDKTPIDYKVWAPTPSLWWDKEEGSKKGAKIWYNEYNFNNAYNRIGYILHLLQDSWCPPHIKVCVHGYFWNIYDDLEYYVDGASHYGYEDGNTPWTFTDKGYTWDYWLSDAADDDDGNNVADGADGGSGIKDGPGSTEPAADNWGIGNTNWGTYGYGGNLDPLDPLPGKNKGEDYFEEDEKANEHIGKEQLKKAYDDTIAEMKARSEALPPLVPDDPVNGQPSISAGIFGPNKEVDISFVAMENRKQTVLLSILAGTAAIKDTSGKVWDGGATATYDLPSDSTSGALPWKGTVTVTWDGDLGSGTLADGEHTIKIKVKDEDGNFSEERTLTVKYDKTKPTGTVSVSVTP